jgi:hypothetical protein
MNHFTYESLSEPYDIFWLFHLNYGNEIPDKSRVIVLNKVIGTKIKINDEFTIITFSPKPPKNTSDDWVYENYPEMKTYLPRAMSLIFFGSKFIDVITGPRKFAGATFGDDDDDEDCIAGIYDPEKTKTWVEDGSCEIVYTEKANGKFSIMKIFEYSGVNYVAFGSKNMHYVCSLENINTFIATNDLSDIVKSIGNDISKNVESLMKLFSLFKEGYSLVGELCDGLHFVPGDNTITWFGLFKNGKPKESITTLELLNSCNIKTVDFETVLNPGDDLDHLTNVLSLSKCSQTEGAVLYIRNIITDEFQMAKSKSAVYIIKRMLREKLKMLTPDIHFKLIKRIVDTASYHGLNTIAAIRSTRVLFDFIKWLLVDKMLPPGVVNFQMITAIKGDIKDIGFAHWWTQFKIETGKDIMFTPNDFGYFDSCEFMNAKELELKNNILVENPPLVIFLQDIQGSGKSTLTNELIKYDFVKIEQDECYGDTNLCQFLLSYYLMQNRNCIVSRCNVNSKQYAKYLSIAQSKYAKVLFMGSNTVMSPLHLATSLAGILHRSKEGDLVMVGRKEYPFNEVLDFTTINWRSFSYHEKCIRFDTITFNDALNIEADNELKKGNFNSFVEMNKERLMSLRIPINIIIANIRSIIDTYDSSALVYKSLKDTSYVSFNLLEESRKQLLEIVTKMTDITNKTVVCEHATQVWYGFGKTKKKANVEVGSPGNSYIIHIDALVINKENGSSAFRIKNINDEEGTEYFVESRRPHITASIAVGFKASDSISFVTSTDDSVIIYDLDLTLNSICVYN